jgi:hypothetical protein
MKSVLVNHLRLVLALLLFILAIAGFAAVRRTQRQTPIVNHPAGAPREVRFALRLDRVGSGTVRKTPDQEQYSPNTLVTLTATPNPGFVFGGWSGDLDKIKSSLSITMNSDLQITANFWAAGQGVIMDETEADLNGWWNSPSKVWGNARYGNYKFAASVAGKENSTAIYRPNLPKAGLYDVWIWYSEGDNRATNALWEVSAKSGMETMTVNQTTNGGAWLKIAGGKPFDQGTNGFVRLTNLAGPIPSVVVADAVAFVYVDL